MAETKIRQYVKQISAEDRKAIIGNSVQSLAARPVSSATEMKKKFVDPIINEDNQPCLAKEIDRVANEANIGLDDLFERITQNKKDIPLIARVVIQGERTYQELIDNKDKEYSVTLGDAQVNKDPNKEDFFSIVEKTIDGYICWLLCKVKNTGQYDKVIYNIVGDIVLLYSPEKVNKLGEDLSALDERLTTAETNVEDLSNKHDSVDESVKVLQNAVSNLETKTLTVESDAYSNLAVSDIQAGKSYQLELSKFSRKPKDGEKFVVVGVDKNETPFMHVGKTGAILFQKVYVFSEITLVSDSFARNDLVKSLAVSLDNTNYHLTITALNSLGGTIDTHTIDLPLEEMIVNGKYEDGNIILTLRNGSEIKFTVSDLVNGVVNTSEKGAANGVASLDANGKVPEEQLPENIGNNNNLENGTGTGAFQQIADGVADGFAYAEYNADGSVKSYKNPTAMEWISDDLKAYIDGGGKIPYGAEGNFSSAIGGKSYTYGKRSHAEGTTTIAFGDYSHVEGNNSVTLGANSHAEGKQTTTLGENAHAEGFDTFAEGYISHSEGYQTHAEGSVSHAEGQGTHAEGDQSHAEGNGTHAQGHYSHSEGYGTHAKGKASHASGEGTIAEGDYQTVVGTYNPPVDMVDLNENTKAKVLFIVGNGKNDAERGIAFAVLDNGEAVSGYGDKPSSDISLINVAQFYNLLSQETTSNLIDGRLPFSVQPKPNIGEGNPDSIADYEYDFVFGKGLRTTNEYETVFGRYNTYSDADWQHPKALFVIGNGTSYLSRSNAFEVKEDGTAYAGGKKVLCEGEVSGGTKLYRHTIKSSSTTDKLIVETYKSTPLVHTETMPDGNDYYLLDYDISKYALNMYVVSNNTFKKVVDFKHTDYDTYVYFYVASGYTFLQEEHIGISFSKAQIPNENYKIEEI